MEPMTARMLVDLGVFPNMKIANRRMNKQIQRRGSGVRRIGAVDLDGCMQWVYYAGRGIASHRIQHETEITQILLRFETERYNRQNVPFDSDVELWIGTEYFLLENERGTNNKAEITRRCLKLSQSTACILWVCEDEVDIQTKIRWTQLVHKQSIYTTFDQMIKHGPHEVIWRFSDGVMTDLPAGPID